MDVYGLLGNPVEHSLSPPMHEAAYDAREIDARYVTFEPTEDALKTAIDGAAALDISGVNVTIPFKQTALEHTNPDDIAREVGAVNTIEFLDGEMPRGYNTDVAGVKRAFRHHNITIDGCDAVVVGAGGAGRAAAFALADAGADVHIANRTVERAKTVAADIGKRATAGGLETRDLISDADILLNATSVGMEPDSNKTPVPQSYLHGGLVVLDAVYTPIETRLLREAAEVGATTIDGAWMLLYQGVVAFEIWTGQDAPIQSMNTALRAELAEM